METTKSILVVDDDSEIRDLLGRFLSKHHYRVDTAEDGHAMDRLLANGRYDLVVLDIMMPGEDGLSICRRLRTENAVPIIMLTAMGDDTDRIVGLELGADDYLPKPFNPRELLARIKAVLRRYAEPAPTSSMPPDSTNYTFNGWRLSAGKRELHNPDGDHIPLTAGEYEMLMVFLHHPQQVLNRDQLMDRLKGRDATPFDRSIDVQLSRLRRKIEPDPKQPALIKTVRGGGYYFSAEVIRS